MTQRKCIKCKRMREHHAKGKCRSCYVNNNNVSIPTCYAGNRGARHNVYTNGCTEELKPQVKEITDKVFRDCINNPRKYLEN